MKYGRLLRGFKDVTNVIFIKLILNTCVHFNILCG